MYLKDANFSHVSWLLLDSFTEMYLIKASNTFSLFSTSDKLLQLSGTFYNNFFKSFIVIYVQHVFFSLFHNFCTFPTKLSEFLIKNWQCQCQTRCGRVDFKALARPYLDCGLRNTKKHAAWNTQQGKVVLIFSQNTAKKMSVWQMQKAKNLNQILQK